MEGARIDDTWKIGVDGMQDFMRCGGRNLTLQVLVAFQLVPEEMRLERSLE